MVDALRASTITYHPSIAAAEKEAGNTPWPTRDYRLWTLFFRRRFIMTDTSAHGAARAAGSYDARPWLKHYAPYVPPDLTPRFASGLEMFLETVKARSEQPAIYYFDQTISYGDLDRQSSALAAALKERDVQRGDRIDRKSTRLNSSH